MIIMADESLKAVKVAFDKILAGDKLNPVDIQQLLFEKNTDIKPSFFESDDFKVLMRCFDFNGDNKVDVKDFQYMKEHISDLSVFLKLTRAATLTVAKISKINNVGSLAPKATLDTAVKIVLYCILYIAVSNSAAFREWAKSNGDVLLEHITDLVSYIKSSQEVSDSVGKIIEGLSSRCSCFSNNVPANKLLETKLEINTLVSQVQKEAKIIKLAN